MGGGGGICPFTLNGDQFIYQQLCTPAICSVQECGQINYIPNLGGNAFYMTVFLLLLIAQIFLCARYKTWGFLIGMFGGITLEILGYGGRIWLHNNIFDFNAFLLYLIPLTIGPAFLSGSIYICLGRIITIDSLHVSRFSPKTYALVFVGCDIFSLVLQAVGGALAAQADTKSQENTGADIMIAGLSYQVFSLLLFLGLWADYAMRARKATESQKNPQYATLRASSRFRYFQYALLVSTILILIRSIYRVAELQGGFGGTIANNEPSFMVLEGPMIILAVLFLTILHPGIVMKDAWRTSEFSFRTKAKPQNDQYQMQASKEEVSSFSELPIRK